MGRVDRRRGARLSEESFIYMLINKIRSCYIIRIYNLRGTCVQRNTNEINEEKYTERRKLK